MKRTFFPLLSSALLTRSTVIISLKLPMWTVPLGVIPAATVYCFLSPFSSMTRSAVLSAQCITSVLSFESCDIMRNVKHFSYKRCGFIDRDWDILSFLTISVRNKSGFSVVDKCQEHGS